MAVVIEKATTQLSDASGDQLYALYTNGKDPLFLGDQHFQSFNQGMRQQSLV